MCIAIFQKPNTPIVPHDHFRNGFNRNSHGCGYMFVDHKRLVVRKGFWDWEELYESYEKDRTDRPNSYFGIHFRLATHGSIDDSNCHPHVIKPDKWALMHTGIMSLNDEYPSNKSDSALLADILSHFSDKELLNIRQNKKILKLVSTYNTVVLMSANHQIMLNESIGHWNNDVWYSNRSYQDYRF